MNCTFCGEKIKPGTGMKLIKSDGTVLNFCSSKCRKNLKLGRKPRKVRWTLKYRRAKGG